MVSPISRIEVFSNSSIIPSGLVSLGKFPVDNNAQRSATLRGEDYVKITFMYGKSIPIPAFAFIEYDGQIFFNKETYRPIPVGDNYYEYSVKFVSFANMLTKPQAYRHVVVDNEEWNEPDIEFNGTLEGIANLIKDSIKTCSSRYEGVFASMLNKVELVSDELSVNSESKTFSFSGQKISQVLDSIANEYDIDYWFEQVGNIRDGISKVKLHFCKCERMDIDPLILSDKTARSNPFTPLRPTISLGLDECSFANEWSGVVQRITPFGAERNITRNQAIVNQMFVSYGKRLRLDYNHSCVINGKTIPHSYAIKNEEGDTEALSVDEFGAVYVPGVTTGEESIEKYDDIYPRGYFRVTHVTQRGTDQPIYTVYAIPTEERNGVFVDMTDAEIDSMQEDENKRLFPIEIADGQTLSIHFSSGYLNGREFEVANKSAKMLWDGSSYKVDAEKGHWVACFEIEPTGDNNESPQVPFGSMVPRGSKDVLGYEGDIFAIFNMEMPPFYVESAQNELAQKAYDEIKSILYTRPEVKCRGNEVFFLNHDMCIGMRARVTSDLFGPDVEFVSRVTNYSFYLSKPSKVDFRLCSSMVKGLLSIMKSAIADQTNSITGIEQTARSISRRAFRDAMEMKQMLETLVAEMMIVGVERNQFTFTMGIDCLDTTSGAFDRKFNGLRITAGEIQHTQEPYIKDAWEGHYIVDPVTLTTDHNGNYINSAASDEFRNTPYYLYAVINNATGKADLQLWAEKKDGDDDEQFLLLGILSSEFEDGKTSLRVFNRSNGYTQIAGGTLTTEQIQDPTRSLIIDMSSNPPRIIARNGAEIIGNIKFKASDTLTAEEQLAALGVRVDGAKAAAEEASKAAQAAKEAGEAAGKAAKEYAEGLADALDENLQNQIDGVIDSYFMEGVPYNTFRPSSDWGTNEVKNRHLGDTYTNILKNKANLAELDGNGNPLWIEQGLLLVGSSHFGKTFEQQRYASANYCRTKTIFENYKGLTIGATPDGIEMLVIFYDTNRQYITNLNWRNTAVTISDYSTYKYISIIYRKSDGSAITPSELTSLTSTELTNPDAGKSWRWCNNDDNDDSTFHWHEIADSDAVLALQKAAEAQDTADEKRRVFVAQPTTPYDIGDLWAQGGASGQDILKCITARDTGSFQQSDWAAASSALSAAADAQQAADKAQSDATSSLTQLGDMSSDSMITPQEKVAIRTEWASIQQEYAKNSAKASELSLTYTAYTNAYNVLNTYLTSTVQISSATTVTITKSEFNSKFSTYYAENVNVLNAIAKALADAAVENVQIGGRNILRGSQNMSFGVGTWESGTWRKSGTGTVSDVDISDAPVAGVMKGIMLSSGNSTSIGIAQDYYGNKFKVGDVLTQSMWVKASKAGVNIRFHSVNNNNYSQNNENVFHGGGQKIITLNDTEWHRVYYTTSPYTSATTYPKGDSIGYLYLNTTNASLTVCAMKLEFGNKATDWTPAQEDVEAEISALDYLKAALTDGSTEIAGGLTMTNVLMLKNLQGAVTAGMSGMTRSSYNNTVVPDNVLMWGGGTYVDAFLAALSKDYLKEDGTTITTLLKKDGTGKIGIFKISDTQAIVDVPNQGKVVIDASSSNGGIFIKDSNFNDKISIIPRSITNSGLKPADSKDWESTKTGSVSASSGSSYMQYGSVNRVNVSGTAISFNSKGTLSISSIVASYSNLRTTVQGNTTNANTVITVGIRNGTGSPIVEYTMSSSSQTLGSGVNVEIPSAGTYYVFFGMKTQCNNGEGKIVNGHADTEVTIKAHFVPSYIPKTIICTDGLISAFNSESYFMIQNTSSGQKIYAKGLSTAKGTSGSGELYVSSSFIEAFKSFLDYMKVWVEDVRSVGSNAEKAEKMKGWCDTVKTNLNDSSLISNS